MKLVIFKWLPFLIVEDQFYRDLRSKQLKR